MMKRTWKRATRLSSKFLQRICKQDSKERTAKNSREMPKLFLMADSNEEYTKAFRRESYEVFWSKVQTLTGNQEQGSHNSTIKSRLPLYRRLAERLLEPHQETIRKLLQSKGQANFNFSLVSKYFTNTAEGFELCGFLLENIEEARTNHRGVQEVLERTSISENFQEDQYNCVIQEFESFSELENPFRVAARQQFQEIQDQYGDLQVELEHYKKLDAVAKGAYILHGDLDTMSRLVRLLHNEIEQSKSMVKLCLERKNERCHVQEVVRMLQKSNGYIVQQLDELEEYVFLCFASINKARRLVVRQIELYQT